ncbi:hypothetical protein [Gluconacetobacter diazotrophicus]|uniref:hypothetical protein n=1 Tax=Gluconacetobacter diazotrophicus TaxID=33996 RepID=UPI0002E16884|nr:hypothetical protein [Gluconacetobacter diazotrophicus]
MAAQNFRNVANRTAPASTATTKSTIAPLGLALLFAAGLDCSACTMTGSTTTIDTAELAADAGAIDFAAQAIESIPTLSSHLSADQVAQVNAALTRIKTITRPRRARSTSTPARAGHRPWRPSSRRC